ncbi:hypothetical protein GGI42DRAFT_311983 [Trichoderma sp. SZMC 28013]
MQSAVCGPLHSADTTTRLHRTFHLDGAEHESRQLPFQQMRTPLAPVRCCVFLGHGT